MRNALAVAGAVVAISGLIAGVLVYWRSDPVRKAAWHLKQAAKNYRLALKQSPEDQKLLNRYRQLLEFSHSPEEARLQLAGFYEEQGCGLDFNPALAELNPDQRLKMGQYLRKRLQEGIPPEERALLSLLLAKLYPQDANLWLVVGKLYLGLGQTEKAALLLEKTLNTGCREPEVYTYLTAAYRDLGRWQEAEKFAREGLAAYDDLNLHKVLLSVYQRQGRADLAREEETRIKTLLAKLELPRAPEVLKKEEKLPVESSGLKPYIFLVVSKKHQILSVCRYDGARAEVIKTYSCTTGKNSGQKEKPGDGRTPEGAFLLTEKIDGRSLPARYGLGAYTLDFPTAIDRMAGRSGNGIWLHGTPMERPPYNSEGCVVLNDKDLAEVSNFVEPKRTFVYIAETPEVVNLCEVMKTIQEWKKSWESLKTEDYLAWYDDRFSTGNKDKSAWAAYKRKVNQSKKYVKISIENLQLIPYGQTPFGEVAVAFFQQIYESNNLRSKAWKKLYLVKREKGWRILSETTL